MTSGLHDVSNATGISIASMCRPSGLDGHHARSSPKTLHTIATSEFVFAFAFASVILSGFVSTPGSYDFHAT